MIESLTQNQGVAGFKPLWSHCVVFLSKTLNLLISTGYTKEDPSQDNRKTVDWDVKNQIKQNQLHLIFCP